MSIKIKLISIFTILIIFSSFIMPVAFAVTENKVNTVTNNTVDKNSNNVITNSTIKNTVENNLNNKITNTTNNDVVKNNVTNNTNSIVNNTVQNTVNNKTNVNTTTTTNNINTNSVTNKNETTQKSESVNEVIAPASNNLGVKYSSHVQNIGWQSWQIDGSLSGTTGKALQVEALKIELQNNVKRRNNLSNTCPKYRLAKLG